MHRYQAGCAADCLKHVVLVMLLGSMVSTTSAFTYVDTHAGAGIYDLTADEGNQHGKPKDGILRLMRNIGAGEASGPLSAYLTALRRGNLALDAEAELRYYLGSPGFAQLWLRPQDKALLLEESAPAHAELKRSLALLDPRARSHVEVLLDDSYRWFSGNALPLLKGRGLILIDPPYDSSGSSDKWNLFLLRQLQEHCPDSCVALWYPCADAGGGGARLRERVRDLRLGDVLAVDLFVGRPSEASGMLIVRPPSGMESKLLEVMPALSKHLHRTRSDATKTSVAWISRSCACESTT